MALNITSGKVSRAQRVVLYGSEGIGKTTLASGMPDPVVIDLEDGSTHLDVRRIANPGSWEGLPHMVDAAFFAQRVAPADAEGHGVLRLIGLRGVEVAPAHVGHGRHAGGEGLPHGAPVAARVGGIDGAFQRDAVFQISGLHVFRAPFLGRSW